jgi:SAM-dependent methyltransferase
MPQSPDDPLAPHHVLMQLAMGRFISQAVMVAARLGVADAIAGGARTTAELAVAVTAHEAALGRLLGALASFGVVADTPAGWTLTPVGQALRDGVPGSVRDVLLFFGSAEHYAAWGALDHAVRTGDSAFARVHGAGTFDYMQTSPGLAGSFDRAMTGLATAFQQAVLEVYDFTGIGSLVDVGGGQGALLRAILARYPAMRGTVFDRPHVIAETTRRNADAGLGERCRAVGGDFFAAVPEGADAYVLSAILHDWGDDRAATILHNIRAAMAPGGRVIAGDFVLEPPSGPDPARLIDLEMLVMTDGGRERTADEFRALFARAGLRLTRIVPTPAGRSLVEGVAA